MREMCQRSLHGLRGLLLCLPRRLQPDDLLRLHPSRVPSLQLRLQPLPREQRDVGGKLPRRLLSLWNDELWLRGLQLLKGLINKRPNCAIYITREFYFAYVWRQQRSQQLQNNVNRIASCRMTPWIKISLKLQLYFPNHIVPLPYVVIVGVLLWWRGGGDIASLIRCSQVTDLNRAKLSCDFFASTSNSSFALVEEPWIGIRQFKIQQFLDGSFETKWQLRNLRSTNPNLRPTAARERRKIWRVVVAKFIPWVSGKLIFLCLMVLDIWDWFHLLVFKVVTPCKYKPFCHPQLWTLLTHIQIYYLWCVACVIADPCWSYLAKRHHCFQRYY